MAVINISNSVDMHGNRLMKDILLSLATATDVYLENKVCSLGNLFHTES